MAFLYEDVNLERSPSPGREGSEGSDSLQTEQQAAELCEVEMSDLVNVLMADGLAKSIENSVQRNTKLLITEADSENSRPALVTKEDPGGLDPGEPGTDVVWWLQKIDELGDLHGWTDKQKCILVQIRSKGAAKRWFDQLDDSNITWNELKQKLIETFPIRDFADMVEKLVARQKKSSESMISYFQSKLFMCDLVGIVGRKAVSMIIKGLPAELRPNAYLAKYASPEDLYTYYLAGLEIYKERLRLANIITPPVDKFKNRESNVMRRCFNCQKIATHLSKNCPEPPAERCRSCGDLDHIQRDCPKKQKGDDDQTENQDGYDAYYDRRFEDSRDLYERRYSGMASSRDVGMRGGSARDFLPPPLPPRREPLPPMPSIGLRGGPSSGMGSSMRESSFSRSASDYGMFSRRSPPPSGLRSSRLYEDFSRDSFDDRRPGLRGASPPRRYAPY